MGLTCQVINTVMGSPPQPQSCMVSCHCHCRVLYMTHTAWKECFQGPRHIARTS